MLDADHLAEDLERVLDVASGRARVPRGLLVPSPVGRLLGMAATDWGIIGLAWLGMALGRGWMGGAGVLIVASRMHSFGVILHDAAHLPLRGKPPRVRLLEVMCGFPLGG